MFSQLSSTQQAALETGTCPHCKTTGNMRKVWTRNGPTVKCDSCGKKVYRPRGRAVASGSGQGSAGMSNDGGQSDGKQSDGQQSSSQQQSSQQSSQAAQAASQSLGKPLSQAAQDAMSKIEQALRQQMEKELRDALARARQEAEQRKQEMEQELAEQVAEQVQELKPTEVIVKRETSTGEQVTTEVKNAHPLLPEVLRRISAGLMNFLLVGPSGSGKTTLVRQVAEALGLPYSVTPWSAGLTEGGVLGRLTPDGNYLPSAYIQAFEQASVHNWDEIDAADPNVPLCANSGIENGEIFLPARVHSPRAQRHAQAYLFATANTWGIGADMLFVGRNQMDAAFRSRFAGGMFYCDYSADLERTLVPEQAYRETFWAIRARIYEHKLRRIWGTRELIRGALLLRAGYAQGEVFAVLTTGFTQDELSKLGVA